MCSDLYMQRDLPTRVKRKIHAIGGTRGIWSMPIKQSTRVSGSTSGRDPESDSIIMSTDANPSPGLSRVNLYSDWLNATLNVLNALFRLPSGVGRPTSISQLD